MYNQVMIDLETLGADSFSSIVSIGAVLFDIETGEMKDEFYAEILPSSCLDFGLHETESTIIWWNKTNPAELVKIRNRGVPLDTALLQFLEWFKKLGDVANICVWGNSNRFDLGLLENAMSKSKMSIPWKFPNERDVRTLVSFAPELKDKEAKVGMAHNALDDCKFQIGYCSKIYRKLIKG